MMSMPPDFASAHYFGTDSSGRDLLVRVAISGRISLMVGIAAAFVAVIVGTSWRDGYIGGRVDSSDDAFTGDIKLLPIYVLCYLTGDLFWAKYLTDLCCHRHGILARYGSYRTGQTL